MGLAVYERDALRAEAVNVSGNLNPFRQSSGRWILRGDESGGAGRSVGHYVGYAPLVGLPFLLVQPINYVPNAIHRRVFATVLMCFEVFRYQKNHLHARISLHSVVPPANTLTPNHHNHSRRILFEERFGEMGADAIPSFISSAGETKTVPAFLLSGIQRAYEGSKCAGCGHSHFDQYVVKETQTHYKALEPISLPSELGKVLSVPAVLETV
jgi:hypothetical protein